MLDRKKILLAVQLWLCLHRDCSNYSWMAHLLNLNLFWHRGPLQRWLRVQLPRPLLRHSPRWFPRKSWALHILTLAGLQMMSSVLLGHFFQGS